MLFFKQELEREMQEGKKSFRAFLELQVNEVLENILELLAETKLPILDEHKEQIYLEIYPNNDEGEYALYIYANCKYNNIPIPLKTGIFKYKDFNLPGLDCYRLSLYLMDALYPKLLEAGFKNVHDVIEIEDDTEDALERKRIKECGFEEESSLCLAFPKI